jgi:hypothetical protein
MALQSRTTAAAAVITLSLTLGVGAAILALVDVVLLAPPPFVDPDSLVTLSEVSEDDASSPRRATYGTFEQWRVAAASMASLEAVDGTNLTLTGFGAAERVSANDVTIGFLHLLGVTPLLGRTFAPGDARQPVVIVSERIWREMLGGDREVIGRTIVLSEVRHTIIGVLPKPSRLDPFVTDF